MELAKAEGIVLKQQQRVACITDVDSEAGRAVARKFAKLGVHLVLNSPVQGVVHAEELEAYRGQGSEVVVTASTLTTSKQVADIMQEIQGAFGRIDILVHNHNAVRRESVEACGEETFDEVLNWNAKSAFLCTQAFGQQMIGQGSGQIVFVSSIHDEKPTGSTFLYATSKGAVKMLAREAALALGRHGIRVNVIEMGPVAGDQERFASDISDIYLHYENKVPSAQLGTCEDLADLVEFLVSDQSRYMNGADIRLDGGFLLHYMDHKMKR